MADIIPFPGQQIDDGPKEIDISVAIFPDGYHSLEIEGCDLSNPDHRVCLARFLESLAGSLLDDLL